MALRAPTRAATAAALTFAALAAALAQVASCARERASADPPCVTWQDDIGPLLAMRCGDCHSGDAPAGGYELGDYGGALGPGSDEVSNARAGDPDAALLAYLDPARADAVHAAYGDLYPSVRDWVLECDRAYFRSALHPGGILDPASADFHGAALADAGWDFALCASCHGEDFAGGAAELACTNCHAGGPTACDTCHAAIPNSGAHQAHALWSCDECHLTPARWDDPGHLDDEREGAEVLFGAFARSSLSGAALEPVYDRASGSCAQVFCHGGSLADAAAALTAPVWTGGPAQAECGTCHGLPPASHAPALPADGCPVCHPDDPALHIDGALAIGRSSDCSGCHGSAASPAPPRDLGGNSSSDAIGVGAHQSHLQASHGLRGPVACSDCHAVPVELGSPGHIDSAAPAEVVSELGWAREQGRCATSWCHGSSAPNWTAVGQDEAACGTCHGVPPDDAEHEPDMPLTRCSECHARTVDEFGNILRTGPAGAEHSEHIDGDVDL